MIGSNRRQLILLVTECHISLCFLAAGLLLLSTGVWILDEEEPWPLFAAPLLLAATLALVSGVVPWVWPAVSLGLRRGLAWLAWIIATLASIGALFPLDYDALLGSQLLLVAAVLMEMNGRPATLRYFWFCLLTLVLVVALYSWLVPLRPLLD